jgi:uncharacterized protein
MSPYRAWRFLLPDLDAPEMEAGLRISERGSIEMVDGRESVRQSILLLISTMPGERVMRPRYGCHLNRLVFSPNDATTAGLAIHYVRQAIERWEPRVEIVHLNAGPDPELAEVLDIVLDYRVRATRQADQVTFAVNLAGEES